ncbi:thioredoxin domain-containing protein [bacterium]|nr:thioredoxin domain-containing protein [bacterium]
MKCLKKICVLLMGLTLVSSIATGESVDSNTAVKKLEKILQKSMEGISLEVVEDKACDIEGYRYIAAHIKKDGVSLGKFSGVTNGEWIFSGRAINLEKEFEMFYFWDQEAFLVDEELAKINDGILVRGDTNAPIKIQLFIDFLCGSCGKEYKELMGIVMEEKDVAVFLKLVPGEDKDNLKISKLAVSGLLEGYNLINEIYDWMFEGKITYKDLEKKFYSTIKQKGGDEKKVEVLINSAQVLSIINSHISDFKKLEGDKTPLIMLGGQLVKASDAGVLKEVIKRKLKTEEKEK